MDRTKGGRGHVVLWLGPPAPPPLFWSEALAGAMLVGHHVPSAERKTYATLCYRAAATARELRWDWRRQNQHGVCIPDAAGLVNKAKEPLSSGAAAVVAVTRGAAGDKSSGAGVDWKDNQAHR